MRVFRPDPDLERLLLRIRQGDDRAWSDLVRQFQALVYSIPKRMGLSEDDCADVFQATFLALYRSIDRIESPKTLPKWLGVTAGREALRLKRVSGRYVQESAEEGRSLEEVLTSEERSAEDMATSQSESHVVRQALSTLGGRCKDLLDLLYQEEEVPYAEISSRLGMPVGAIGPTRARCLEKLRHILAREGMFEEDVSSVTAGAPLRR
ncbi:MAG TPA: sigma-70 family RNA polymerase sigma factor [Fimbriimonadaceae bacterium]|nr:sigma-70 family RNA polymerase sigma factor [Fimbriimonadaceae bacterium]